MVELLHRLSKVKDTCGLSRTEVYRQIRAGTFPKPVAIGARAVAWRESEVQAWIAARSPKAAAK